MNNMKTLKSLFKPDKAASFILYLSILAFTVAFNFSDHGNGGWQQQFMPFLNNRPIADITFLDSLTGYAVSSHQVSVTDTSYILKTTNSGESWFIVFTSVDFRIFRKVMFINLDTGFVLYGDSVLRTTNAGENWRNIHVPDNFSFSDMFPVSYDTMWLSFDYFGLDYIYRTTNAGLSWTNQLQGNSFDKLYFFNNRIGFVGSPDLNVFLKTTNSGINWLPISGNGFKELYFTDSLTGWNAKGSMKKTIDGGQTWIVQTLPSGGNIFITNMLSFSNINKDTIWGTGGVMQFGNSYRGMIYRTTNGGSNWAYQIPDTSIHLLQYYFCNFINKLNGWVYIPERSGVHTSIGGDTSFVTSIKSAYNITPDDFMLYQNFPNPFNPKTKIIYELRKSSKVSVVIFDILGKEISKLVNKNRSPGKYEIEFDAAGMTSGIYFYCLVLDDLKVDTKKMMLLR